MCGHYNGPHLLRKAPLDRIVDAFANPPPAEIRRLLERAREIAVVGLSPKADRPSFRVAKALQDYGYRIIPVRPGLDEVLGEPAIADLADMKEPVDIVDVFRAPEYVGPIVDQCIELGVPALWLQEGVVNEEAAARARAAGIFVVMDRCIFKQHKALFGE